MEQNLPQQPPFQQTKGRTLRRAFGASTVIVAAFASAVLFTYLQGAASDAINNFFNISTEGGDVLGGIGFFLLAFLVNLLLWGVISIQLAKK